jgi:class 3 adenylate cyclase/type II secretory pathway predicted ATPase ExeA
VDCSNCDRTNRPGAKFCAGCATPISAPCASCGHVLAPEARFCDQCGTPVDAETGPDAVAEAATPDDAVRKTVTVMFCDLAGSTSLEERVDAESSRDILGRYHSMVEAVVGERDGTVAKFIGDGAMVLFGVPEVGVDDADRAVAAGLELQRRFLSLRTHIADRFGIDVGLRVGINTGEVVISDDDADLVGDPLNTAARIEAACPPGRVLVGEDTWRVTRSSVAYETFGEIELKGKARPVGTHRAVDLLAAPDESATPFVGRDGEMNVLQAVFDEAVSTRSAQLATVIGAPGVGKTRLARELERSLADRATIVELRCERAGGTTFAPIADLLRSLSGLDDSMSADEVVGELTRLVGELDDADRVANLLGSFVGAAPMRSTEETFFAVRRLVEALGRRYPIALVVDDIQWAEPLFLDLLEHLAEWVHDAPTLVLGLARPELREIRPSLAEAGRRVAESIHLEGLDAGATAELAGLLVGGDALPRDLLARLPESTEGNPLFVRELMKMLIDDHVIVETDGRWELSIDADAVEVPPTIQSLLSSRIERMPDDERRLVELASVVGPDFALGAVAAISAPADADRLMPTLERLRRKELVEPTGTYWGDEPGRGKRPARAGGCAGPTRADRRVRGRARSRARRSAGRRRRPARGRGPRRRPRGRAVGSEPGVASGWALPRRDPAAADHDRLARRRGDLDALPSGARSAARAVRHRPVDARRGACDRRGAGPSPRPAGDRAVQRDRGAARRRSRGRRAVPAIRVRWPRAAGDRGRRGPGGRPPLPRPPPAGSARRGRRARRRQRGARRPEPADGDRRQDRAGRDPRRPRGAR